MDLLVRVENESNFVGRIKKGCSPSFRFRSMCFRRVYWYTAEPLKYYLERDIISSNYLTDPRILATDLGGCDFGLNTHLDVDA